MVRKNTSIERIVREFKDVSISDISLIQALYTKKDAQGIRSVLNKKKFVGKGKDIYGLALGRLANQYINMMYKPTNKEVNHINKKFKIKIQLNNYPYNIKNMGNIKQHKGGYKVDSDKGIKVDDRVNRTVANILTFGNLGNLFKTQKGYAVNIKFTPYSMNKVIRELNMSWNNIKKLKAIGINRYHLIVKYRFENKNEGMASSKIMDLGDVYGIKDLFDRLESSILLGNEYEWKEEFEIIDKILTFRVSWRY